MSSVHGPRFQPQGRVRFDDAPPAQRPTPTPVQGSPVRLREDAFLVPPSTGPRPPAPPRTASPAPAKKSGGGFLGGIGRFLGGLGRTIGRAVGAIGRVVGAVGRAVVQGAQYVAGGVRGLVAGTLYRLGLGNVFPGLVPAKYPVTPQQIAADGRRIEQRFGQAIRDLPAAPRQMLDQMRQIGVSDTDLFHGSHVVAEDGGRLYDQWRQLPGARERTSSHYGGGPPQQYEMTFPGIGVVLFGKNPEGHTFFQMEAHSDENRVQHTSDFLLHVLSGHQNVGPAGLSPHSEKEGREIRIPVPADTAN